MVRIGDAEISQETRQELIAYYKWVVGLSTFVLTASIGFPAFGSEGKEVEALWLLVCGWILLSFCIIANWMIIKILVSLSVIESVSEDGRGPLHRRMASGLGRRLGLYGKIQNWSFILGFILVTIGFANNV